MKTLDPGHIYQLSVLDVPEGEDCIHMLVFVKRQGEKYPGNTSSHPGTTLQEVLRACIDRVKHLDKQDKSTYNEHVIWNLEQAIVQLEDRAAERHGRPRAISAHACVYGPQCPKCLHVGCEGQCHNTNA